AVVMEWLLCQPAGGYRPGARPEGGGIAGKRRQFGSNEEIAFASDEKQNAHEQIAFPHEQKQNAHEQIAFPHEQKQMLTSKSLFLTSKSECLRPCNNGSPARRTEHQLACSRISDI